jgi:hypothetical protein
MKENTFFIGWQAEQDKPTLQLLRLISLGIISLVSIIAIVLAAVHINYSNGIFERNKVTAITGILRTVPAPFLEIRDASATTTLLLVSPGKFGAEKSIREQGRMKELENKLVNIQGHLIYNGAHTLLEINDISLVSDSLFDTQAIPNSITSNVKLRGEIADPKCLFGVMNPGEGKVHKDCAVRCISGGITPVFKSIRSNGDYDYYLVLNEDNSTMQLQLLPFVADQVEICGKVGRFNEWKIFYPDLSTLKRIQSYNLPAVTVCNL